MREMDLQRWRFCDRDRSTMVERSKVEMVEVKALLIIGGVGGGVVDHQRQHVRIWEREGR